jgi:putative addiction module killer protein
MREHYGSGYRIFYRIIENTIVLLLAGSTKKEQSTVIAKAKDYLADYERRQTHAEKSR